ncbi:DNA-directed RNA polymerases I and III subunit RPAC2 [Pancytospora epiphaga]|nr:DNA-directed RNA polymerases I and III subunit RPAC2 [Pancytospora epiphaga]
MDETNRRIKFVDEFTVEIAQEDHTLMNPLRWVISNNWDGEKVEFCGYNIPHPSESVAHLTVQFEDENLQNRRHVLSKIAWGLETIENCCGHLLEQLGNEDNVI